MINAPYNAYNPQASIDRINNQIAELERLKQQIPTQPIQQPTNLTQNFQLAPNNSVIRYANSIEDVQKDIVIGDTPFFSQDLSILWIKNTKGDIKSYELNEIIEKDEKDIQIEYLQSQVNELKGMIENAKSTNEYVGESVEDEESSNVSVSKPSSKKSK